MGGEGALDRGEGGRARLKIWLAMKLKMRWKIGGEGQKMERKRD